MDYITDDLRALPSVIDGDVNIAGLEASIEVTKTLKGNLGLGKQMVGALRSAALFMLLLADDEEESGRAA